MWILILFFLDLMGLEEKQKLSIPLGFRRMGNLATGLQYGHLQATINLTRKKEMHYRSKDVVTHAFEKISLIHENDVRQKLQP